ncbi:MAG: 30S ribosomal protein S20 [Kiritimatiellae bacterium]|nr:30S ribosomal protein S20 [Kiritimatiellia bacterium]
MPNIKSAKKRMLTSEKSRVRNQAEKTKVKHARRSFMESVESQGKEVSAETLKSYCSVLDKAAKKGIIGKNTAVRRKRRAMNRVRTMA